MSSEPMKLFRVRRWFAAPRKKCTIKLRRLPVPDLPIIWSEYNASYKNETAVTDSVFMGPWLADTIRQCDGFNRDDGLLDVLGRL